MHDKRADPVIIVMFHERTPKIVLCVGCNFANTYCLFWHLIIEASMKHFRVRRINTETDLEGIAELSVGRDDLHPVEQMRQCAATTF